MLYQVSFTVRKLETIIKDILSRILSSTHKKKINYVMCDDV